MEDAEKLEVAATHGRQDLLNSNKSQQGKGEHKQQEEMHLEGQNSYMEDKEQKGIDIVTNHQIPGGNSMEDLGGHSDNLGEKTYGKYTMENQKIFGIDVFETEKNLCRSPQQSIVLPFDNEADQSSVAENEVDASRQNAIPESKNKSTAVILSDMTESDYTCPAADEVQPIRHDANETYEDQIGDANSIKMIEEEETGTPEDQAAFINELKSFYKEKGMDFTPPRLYGKILNCLKLYRAVIRLGGYDQVTRARFWRQIGISHNFPKTYTSVSYAFRIFYKKALLEYERHKLQNSKLQLALPSVPEPPAAANMPNGYQTTGSGRAKRDAATFSEIAQPIIKNKSLNMAKCKKELKTIGSVKNKWPKEVEHPVKVARTETFKQLVPTVVDVGPRADWVKINVRENIDCFEVYALVPGLLREEIKVKSDPKGRLVITGQPEHHDNPWGITAFQKVVSLPARIDPLQMSAVVTLHGQLYVHIYHLTRPSKL